MTEYVSKTDVLNLPQSIERNLRGEIVERSIDVKDIESLKPADVAPVVRCENCIHWSDSNQCARPELSGSRWHDPKYFDTYPDDFCSYGERREE